MEPIYAYAKNGTYIRIRQKWILEVDLKKRGVHVPPLEVGFPKQKGKNADTDQYNY